MRGAIRAKQLGRFGKALGTALMVGALVGGGVASAAITHFTGVVPTPISMTVFGVITERITEGQDVAPPVSTEVGVYDPQGVLCGAAEVKASYLGGRVYILQVYGDDDTTPVDEGAVAGDKLKFVAYVPAHDGFAAKEYRLPLGLALANGQSGTPPPALPPSLVFAERESYGMDMIALYNRSPNCVVASGSTTGAENSAMSFALSCTDPENDLPITVVTTSQPNGSTYDDGSRTFSWTPPYTAVVHPGLQKDYTVSFAATDNADSSKVFDVLVTVTDVNRSPSCTPSTASGAENTPIAVTLTCTDPDDDTVALAEGTLPTGASFDAGSKTFTWTPAYPTVVHPATVAAAIATFTATDGFGASVDVPLAVTVNDVNQVPKCKAIPDKPVNEAATVAFALSCSDPDNDTLRYSATNLPAWCTQTGASVSCTPDNNVVTMAEGTKEFTPTFKADDGWADTNGVIARITVTSVNVPPTLTTPIGDQNVLETQTLTFSVTATDPDLGDTVAVTATGLPDGATFQNGTFAWTPGPDVATKAQRTLEFPVTFTASDTVASVSQVVKIIVENLSNAPEITDIAAKTVNEGEVLTFTVSVTDRDAEDTVTLAADGLPSTATFDPVNGNPASGVFSWKPPFEIVSLADGTKVVTVTFSARDDGGAPANAKTVSITVKNVNHAPVLAEIGAKSVDEGKLLTFGVPATDPDNDPITIMATGLPTGARFENGTFSWAPTFKQAGSYIVTFMASDTDKQDPESVTVTVADVPQAPVADAGPDQLVTGGAMVILDASNSHDVDGTIATYHWDVVGVRLDDAGNKIAHFTAPAGGVGGVSLLMTLTATDDEGNTGADDVYVNVRGSGTNRPPVANAGPDQPVDPSATVTLHGQNSSDPDGNVATHAWRQLSGTLVDLLPSPTAKEPTFTAPATAGALVFELVVADAVGLVSTDTVTVNVLDVDQQAPTADAGPDQPGVPETTGNVATVVTLDGSASTDLDGVIVSHNWRLVSGPAVELSDPSAAKPTFTAPAVGPAGAAFKFELTVTDNDGLTHSASTLVNVTNLNVSPVADAGWNQTVDEGAAVTLDGSASKDPDPDGVIVEYLWEQTGGPAVTLSDPAAVSLTFTAPQVTGDQPLTFKLTVKDDLGAPGSADVTVTVHDTTPPGDDSSRSSSTCLINAVGQGLGSSVLLLLELAAVLCLLGVGRGKRS